MPKKIICTVEPAIEKLLESFFVKWDVQAIMIPCSNSMGNLKQLLPEQEKFVECWANAVIEHIEDDSALLVQVDLIPGKRAKGYGLLLAERIRAERIIPTIIMTLDTNIATRNSTRRARLANGKTRFPVVPIITGDDIQNKFASRIPFVVWDPLSGKNSFNKSYNAAQKTIFGIRPQQEIVVKSELVEALQDEEAAALRHRIKNMLASLRILDGAYRNGWLTYDEVTKSLTTLQMRAVDENQKKALESLANTLYNILQSSLLQEASPRDMTLVVCDDLWETAGWDQVIPPMVSHLFGMDTHGVVSLNELALYLEKASEELIPPRTLLLDVHVGTENVDADYLEYLHKDFPDLDIILFTTDLNDGVLVRKVYELGYRIFFKELDESARNTRQYATHLRQMLEQSIRSYPIMHLLQFAEKADSSVMVAEPAAVIKTMQSVMRLWRDTGETSSVLGLTALHERLTKCVHAMANHRESRFPTKVNSSSVDWGLVLSRICNYLNVNVNDCGLPFTQLFQNTFYLAKYSRNQMAHNADMILEADTNMPALGIALTQIIASITLSGVAYPIAIQNSNEILDDEYLSLSLLEFAKSIYYSTESMKPRTRSRFKSLVEDGAFCEAPKLLQLLNDLSHQADPIFMGKTGMPVYTPTKFLHNEIVNLNNNLDKIQEMNSYQWVLVLYCILVLDR